MRCIIFLDHLDVSAAVLSDLVDIRTLHEGQADVPMPQAVGSRPSRSQRASVALRIVLRCHVDFGTPEIPVDVGNWMRRIHGAEIFESLQCTEPGLFKNSRAPVFSVCDSFPRQTGSTCDGVARSSSPWHYFCRLAGLGGGWSDVIGLVVAQRAHPVRGKGRSPPFIIKSQLPSFSPIVRTPGALMKGGRYVD
jgi:hypothetical protein